MTETSLKVRGWARGLVHVAHSVTWVLVIVRKLSEVFALKKERRYEDLVCCSSSRGDRCAR